MKPPKLKNYPKLKGGLGAKPYRPKKDKPSPHGKKPKGLDPFYKNFNANDPLTGKALKRRLNAATRLEYDPLERQLRSEAMASSDRANRILPAWYSDYQQKLATLRGETQAQYDKSAAAIQGDANQAATQDSDARAAIAARLQHDAELRGTTVDPNVDVSGAGAAAARRATSNAIYGTVQGQGANQYAYGTNRQAIALQAGREASDTEAARGRKIASDQRELASKKGDFRTDLLRQLIEDERKFGLSKGALGIDKKKLRESMRHNKASEAETARGHSLTAGTAAANRRAQNRRDRKNRRQDARQQAQDIRQKNKDRKASGKGKGKKL